MWPLHTINQIQLFIYTSYISSTHQCLPDLKKAVDLCPSTSLRCVTKLHNEAKVNNICTLLRHPHLLVGKWVGGYVDKVKCAR